MFNYLPDAEQAIIDKLKADLPGIVFATREPSPRPDEYVRLFLGAGSEAPVPTQESFTVTVESWHRNRESRANAVAEMVRCQLMGWGWARGVRLENNGVSSDVRRVTGARPVSYPGEDGWARYTATYQLTITH